MQSYHRELARMKQSEGIRTVRPVSRGNERIREWPVKVPMSVYNKE